MFLFATWDKGSVFLMLRNAQLHEKTVVKWPAGFDLSYPDYLESYKIICGFLVLKWLKSYFCNTKYKMINT